jgi:hypothetical protein
MFIQMLARARESFGKEGENLLTADKERETVYFTRDEKVDFCRDLIESAIS